MTEAASREVINRLFADLIHINRATQKTEPALAKSWTVSKDGLHYVLELRRGIRFSDGHPFDADDVVFTFQAMLDEKVDSLQRSLLILNGKPITVRKLDSHRVAFDLPAPYSVAERLFDGFAILPRHLLERPYREGKLAEAWGLRTSPSQIAGLGPYRLKEYSPGQRIVLERNPYYWKTDAAGNRLPYLDELHYAIAGTEDMQVLRLRSGDADMVNRLSAKNFAALQKDADRRGLVLANAGPGFEYSFLFFNLNDLPPGAPAAVRDHQRWFRSKNFRQAVSAAIHRDDMVRLVYQGFAQALASPVPPGSRAWIDGTLPRPARQLEKARELLRADGFRWLPDGSLTDAGGARVEFTIAVSASSAERGQMATLMQDDLKALGMKARVAPLEFRSLLERVQKTFDYDTCVLGLASADADPNVEMGVWLASGANHLWQLRQEGAPEPWQAEIDSLMQRQIGEPRHAERKRLFDRVQQLAMEYLPMVPLVTPNVLIGVRKDLANFQPALLEHNSLWNVDALYWRSPGRGPAR